MRNWIENSAQKMRSPRPNDGAFYFFWTITFFEVLVTVLNVAWMIEPTLVREFGLVAGSSLFLMSDVLYAFFNDQHGKHAVEHEGSEGRFAVHRRHGEIFGAAFVIINAMVIPLAGALMSILSDSPEASMVSHAPSFWAISAAIGGAFILGASSYNKMKLEPNTERRARYNRIIYGLLAFTQITIMILIVLRAFFGTEVPAELFGLLVALLVIYIGHNQRLKECCPDIMQQRRGHLIATSISLFTAGLLLVFSLTAFPGIREYPVGDASALFLITMVMFFLGTVHKRYRAKQNGINQNNGGGE